MVECLVMRRGSSSVTDVNGDGGGRIMNFDAVKDVEEMEVMEEMDDISNLLLHQPVTCLDTCFADWIHFPLTSG